MTSPHPTPVVRTRQPVNPALSVAPMIDVSNRHFRMLIRCVSPLPVVWTEMTWDRAILYNSRSEPEHALNLNPVRPLESIIGFSEEERPVVLQLGGADPAWLARAVRLGAARGKLRAQTTALPHALPFHDSGYCQRFGDVV